MAQIEAEDFRDGQQAQWDIAAAGWKKWSARLDEATGHVSEALVEMAGVRPGSRVLDIAAGYGEPALTAARVAGPDGHVVATDISPQMVAFGRERAAAAGVENLEFQVSDAASLDFPSGSFDAATSRFGIIFDPDGEGAAARVRDCLVPGGRMAIASWGPPERMPMIAIPMVTAITKTGAQPPPPGTPGPLSRPTDEAIAGLLEGGGFRDIEVRHAEVSMAWSSAEEFTEFIREIAPPITALIAGHPQEAQDEVWLAITEAMRAHAGADGRVELANEALLAVGTA